MSSPSFKEIKKRVETLRSQRERAEGALEQIETRLGQEFDTDLDTAHTKLEELETASTAAKAAYDDALEIFMEKWSHLLELDDDDL